MKPLPDFGDASAMVMRGKISTLYSLRKEASEALRDALVEVQSAPWGDRSLEVAAAKALSAAARIEVLATMWTDIVKNEEDKAA